MSIAQKAHLLIILRVQNMITSLVMVSTSYGFEYFGLSTDIHMSCRLILSIELLDVGVPSREASVKIRKVTSIQATVAEASTT